MPVTVATPPTAAISLDEAKAHLRVTTSDNDALITAYIAAAQGQIDGPDGTLGRSIGVQTLEWSAPVGDPAWGATLAYVGACGCDGWNTIVLPCGPVIDITSVVYGAIPVDQSLYVLLPGGALQPVASWPWSWSEWPSVRVRYRAGYLPTPADQVNNKPAVSTVPGPIKMALLMMVQDLWSTGQRDPALTTDTVYGVGSQQFSTSATAGGSALQASVAALLAPYRVFA